MLSDVKVSDVIEPFWMRWTRSTQAGSCATGMSVAMFSLATWASCGYCESMFTGLTWSSSAPMRQRWRRIREKSSDRRRDRAYQRAWYPSSFWTPGSIHPRCGDGAAGRVVPLDRQPLGDVHRHATHGVDEALEPGQVDHGGVVDGQAGDLTDDVADRGQAGVGVVLEESLGLLRHRTRRR